METSAAPASKSPASMDFVATRSDVKIGGRGPSASTLSSIDFVAQNSTVTFNNAPEEEREQVLLRRRNEAEQFLKDGALKLAYHAASAVVLSAPGYTAARLILIKASQGLGKSDEVALHCTAIAVDSTQAMHYRSEAARFLLSHAETNAIASLVAATQKSVLAVHLLFTLADHMEDMALERRVELVRGIWRSVSEDPVLERREKSRQAAIFACNCWYLDGEKSVGIARLRAEDLESKNVEAWVHLAATLEAGGELTDARAALEKAVDIDAQCADAWRRLGDVRWELGDSAGGLEAVQRACTLRPDLAEYQGAVGCALCALDRREESLAYFRKACQLEADKTEWPNRLGVAYWELGQTSEAIAQFERATQIDPDDPVGWEGLAAARSEGIWQDVDSDEAELDELFPDIETGSEDICWQDVDLDGEELDELFPDIETRSEGILQEVDAGEVGIDEMFPHIETRSEGILQEVDADEVEIDEQLDADKRFETPF